MTTRTYFSVDEDTRKLYGALVILNLMVQERLQLNVALDGDNNFLEPLINFLMDRDYIQIHNAEYFVPTKKGRDIITKFQTKYVTYLRAYDHFGSVNLRDFTFGIERIHEFDLETDEGWDAWQDFLNSEDEDGDLTFTDLRIAVAIHKGINPVEIVFMSLLNEGTFLYEDGTGQDGWQFNLAMGTRFDEIEEIVNSAWKVIDLDQSEDDGPTGQDVIVHVLERGVEARKAVVAAEMAEADETYEETTTVVEVVEEIVVDEDGWYPPVEIPLWAPAAYHIYTDPLYVDPCFAIVVYDEDWHWR